MIKIELTIDNTCKQCQKAIERLELWNKRHPNCYAAVVKETGELVKGIILRPDYNAGGNRTHYHIECE